MTWVKVGGAAMPKLEPIPQFGNFRKTSVKNNELRETFLFLFFCWMFLHVVILHAIVLNYICPTRAS